jgi:hypothetical protein
MYRELYGCDILLKGLAPHLQDVAAALRQFIQKEHAVMGQRHLTWPRHVVATDQPDI